MVTTDEQAIGTGLIAFPWNQAFSKIPWNINDSILTFKRIQIIVDGFQRCQQPPFIDKRQQSYALPSVLFAIQIDDKIFRVKIENRRTLIGKNLFRNMNLTLAIPCWTSARPRILANGYYWPQEKRPSVVREDWTWKNARNWKFSGSFKLHSLPASYPWETWFWCHPNWQNLRRTGHSGKGRTCNELAKVHLIIAFAHTTSSWDILDNNRPLPSISLRRRHEPTIKSAKILIKCNSQECI